MQPRPRRRRQAVGAAVALLAWPPLVGCNVAAPPVSPTAGVDDLVIPTADPEPEDFSADIDNPWFPLPPGRRWTYSSPSIPADGVARTVTVVDGITIDGVRTRGLRTEDSKGATVSLDYYAQDTDGNVWWFGREGDWRAGTDGARAGLLMAARPRVGDGYRQALAPGVVDLRARVLEVGIERNLDSGSYDELVVVELTDGLDAGSRVIVSYAPGIGLVESRTDTGDEPTLVLEDVE